MDAFSDGFTRLVQEHLGFRLQPDSQLEIRSAKAYGCLYLMLHSSSLSQNEDPFVSACDAYERYVGQFSDDPSKLPALPCLHVILYGTLSGTCHVLYPDGGYRSIYLFRRVGHGIWQAPV